MKFSFIIAFIFTSVSLSQTQIKTELSPLKYNEALSFNLNNDALSFYKTTANFFESPLHFDGKDFILTGIIAGATALSFSLDDPVRNKVGSFHSSTLDKFTGIAEKFGTGTYVTAFTGAVYLAGYLAGDGELRKTGLMLAEAVFLNGITTEGLKIIIGRSRPFTNEGNNDIDFLEMKFNDEETSFPSGHTSTAFTIATILSNRINNTYASIALYSIAGLTAFQRIYADKHWFSDTILGAALGTIIGLKVIDLNSEFESESSDMQMNITPVLGNERYGIGLVFNF